MQNNRSLPEIAEKLAKMLPINASQISTPLPSDRLKMPQLALTMAAYFNSLSKNCMNMYYAHSAHDPSVKKRRTIRDREMSIPPKKPLSAYIRYYGQKFGAFQQKYPSYAISQLTKIVAQEWTKLPAKQKEPYLIKAAEEKKKYEEEKKLFMSRNPAYQEKKKLWNNGRPRAKNIPDEKRRPSRQLKNKKEKVPEYSDEEQSFSENSQMISSDRQEEDIKPKSNVESELSSEKE